MKLAIMTKQELELAILSSVSAVFSAYKEEFEQIKALAQAPGEERRGEEDPDYLTKSEAARRLSVSTSTIDNFAAAGKLTRYYLPAGRGKDSRPSVRFKTEEVLGILEASK